MPNVGAVWGTNAVHVFHICLRFMFLTIYRKQLWHWDNHHLMLWGSSKPPGAAQGWTGGHSTITPPLPSFWEPPTTGCASLLRDFDETHPATSGWMSLRWYHSNLSNVLWGFPLFGPSKRKHLNISVTLAHFQNGYILVPIPEHSQEFST